MVTHIACLDSVREINCTNIIMVHEIIQQGVNDVALAHSPLVSSQIISLYTAFCYFRKFPFVLLSVDTVRRIS